MENMIVSMKTLRINEEKKKAEQLIAFETYKNNSLKRLKVNMMDLETGLSYMFRREIPQMKEIQGESYDSLLQWLTVLTKVSLFLA
jgi:hypothetical protein